MKNLIYIVSLIILFQFCSPDDIPPIGDPPNRAEQIVGTWQLTSFLQTEVDARNKSFPEFATTMDLTNVFPDHPYTDFSIIFNEDGTFTTNIGESYVEMLDRGTWKFDDDDFPTSILLSQDTEVQEVEIGSLGKLIFGEFQFSINRIDTTSNTTVIIYEYNMIKQ